MNKIKNIIIVLTFLGLWVTSIVPSNYEVILGFILIFSFGILHGSNDILLIENTSQTKSPFLKVLISYLVIVLSAVLIFYYLPAFALVLFIFFSGFHFGEQHWENEFLKQNTRLSQCYFFLYGLFILTLLFIFNTHEVIAVVNSIINYELDLLVITVSFIITSSLISLLTIYMLYTKRLSWNRVGRELFYIIILAIVFKVSTLIWGFAIYFVLWHSIPSLIEQIQFIYGGLKRAYIISYLKKAFPYWIISLIGLALVSFLFKEEKLLYAIIFSFIAAVTFPHSLVITRMFKHKKTQSN